MPLTTGHARMISFSVSSKITILQGVHQLLQEAHSLRGHNHLFITFKWEFFWIMSVF